MEKKAKIKAASFVLFLICLAIGAGALTIYTLTQFAAEEQAQIANDAPQTEELSDEKEPEQTGPLLIDLQSTIDGWVGSIHGNASILITDLDNNQVIASHKPTEDYNTASLYKLFVAYEGYKRIANNQWDPDENAAFITSDRKEFKVPVSTEGKTYYSISDCLDLAIRESFSPCAEVLWDKIGRSELDRIIAEDYQITNSKISNLTSNPEDITKILKMFYEHKDWNEETQTKVLDTFSNQPVTTYDWRGGLPSGFSENAKVYNKVGWLASDGMNYDFYHDAAIINIKDHNYIIVVMTQRVTPEELSNLAIRIETGINGAEENYAVLHSQDQ